MGPCNMFSSDLTFVVPQSKCRDLPPRQRVVKFPTAMRFDTVWANICRSRNVESRRFNARFTPKPAGYPDGSDRPLPPLARPLR
jgi:hypothetical protein